MIGALAIKNRRKKQHQLTPQSSIQVEKLDGFRTKCHFLYISAGACALISIIILIPAFFGNTSYFIYSGSFFGGSLILFACACVLHSDPRTVSNKHNGNQRMTIVNGLNVIDDVEQGPIPEKDASPRLEYETLTNLTNNTVEVTVTSSSLKTISTRPTNGATVEHPMISTMDCSQDQKIPPVVGAS